MIEFIKLGQTARDDVWFLNTGQLLSVPFVIAGIILIFLSLKHSKNEASL
jgi:prolipoprotein diacylglyceryltransferase